MLNSEQFPSPVTIRVVTEITTTVERATKIQQEVVAYLGRIGGISASIELIRGDKTDSLNNLIDNLGSREQEKELHRQLSSSIQDSVNQTPYSSNTVSRTNNALARDNISTLRDVLVIGKIGIGEIRNIGKASEDAIEEALKAKLGSDLTWKERPTISDIATYCSSLGQINVRALNMPYPYSSSEIRRLSIADLLVLNPRELTLKASMYYRSSGEEISDTELATANGMLLKARQFTDQFFAARRHYLDQL